MELLEYIKDNLIHFSYKSDEDVNSIGICYNLAIRDNSKIVKEYDDYLKLNETIFNSNVDILLELSEKPSKEKIREIIEKTIDKINDKFIFYTITTDGVDCSDINQMYYVIYHVNNSLYNLNKKIKLYELKKDSDLEIINELSSITLGEKYIFGGYDYINYKSINNSLTLFELISTLTGINIITTLDDDKYGLNFTQCSKIYSVLDLIRKY